MNRFSPEATIKRRPLYTAALFALFLGGIAAGCATTESDDGNREGAVEDDIRADGVSDHDGTGEEVTTAADIAEESASDDDDDNTEEQELAAAARVASPVPGKKVTYPYGVKNPRYAAGYHTGDDYAAAKGTNVVAVRAGKIRWSNGNGGAYGNWIGLDADNGRTYVYCHLSTRSVAAGKTIKAGQVIGKVGATGNVTGPHLHFEDHPKGNFVYAKGRKPKW